MFYQEICNTRFKFEIKHEVSIISFNLLQLIKIEKISEFDKGSIVAYRKCEISNCWISEKLSRCYTTIGKFLQKYDKIRQFAELKAMVGRGKELNVKTEK